MNNKEYLVVKASAGTGKTYRLSLEYVYSLCMNFNYKNILVMTFTKKATSEIKTEVMAKLKKFLEIYEITVTDENDSIEESINKNTKISEKQKTEYISLIQNIEKLDNKKEFKLDKVTLIKLRNIYAEILKNKEKMKIYTIDSFINLVFRSLVVNIMKIKNFSMIDDAENEKYYKNILEEIFNNKKLYEQFKKFFVDNTEKDIDSYLEIIKKLIEDRWKYLLSLDENGNYRANKKLEEATDIVEKYKSILEYIKDEKNTGKVFEEKFINSSFVETLNFNDEKLEEYLLKIGNFYNIVDKNIYDGRHCFNTKGYKENKEILADKKEELASDIAKILFNREIIPYERDIMELSKVIYEIYDQEKLKDKKFNFNDISTYTYMTLFNKNNAFVNEEGLKQEIFDSLDMDIDVIFIDEFQDTSVLQWKLLYEFIKKAKRVICVGDEKQSIYGWRGGEKRLFEKLPLIFNINPESLKVSYRSDKNIVDYTNKYFKQKENELKENQIDWRFEEIAANSKNDGFVKNIKVSASNSNKKFLYSNLLEEIKKYNFKSYSDIAIIARENKTLSEIAKVFEEEKIPYTKGKKTNVRDKKGVYECCELINYFTYGTELSLYNFLAADFNKFGTETIKKLLMNKNDVIAYINFDSENKKILNLENKKIIEVLDKIKLLKTEYKKLSIENLVYTIIDRFNILSYFSKENEIKNICEFYLLCSNYTSAINLLEDYTNDKLNFSDSKEKKGVELITIHASKGLQYKTVFYINIDTKKIDREKNKFLFEMNSTYDDIDFSMFYKGSPSEKSHKKIMEKCFQMRIDNFEKKLVEEEINNIYVAMTRAKNNMIIFNVEFYKEDNKKKDSIEVIETIGDFVNHNETLEIESPHTDLQKEMIENFFEMNIVEKEKYEIEINRSKFLLETEEKRMIGLLIHSFLENIRYGNATEIEYSKTLCYKEYLSYFGEKKMNKLFSKENIKKYLTTDERIFSKEWDYIYSEYEIYDLESQKEYRIDRIMIREPRENENGKVYIIDYKTGRKNETQLITYRDILLKKFPELESYDIDLKYIEFDI